MLTKSLKHPSNYRIFKSFKVDYRDTNIRLLRCACAGIYVDFNNIITLINVDAVFGICPCNFHIQPQLVVSFIFNFLFIMQSHSSHRFLVILVLYYATNLTRWCAVICFINRVSVILILSVTCTLTVHLTSCVFMNT